MVAPTHARLSIVRQCHLVSIARSSFYYEGQGESPVNLRLLRVIDEQFLETPFYGSRQMTRWLRRQGDTVSRKRVRRLMRRLGVHAVCQRPRTSQSHPGHRIYPYLLRDLQITQPNHVWCTDVTYIPLQRGFLYLVAVMDWASRTVLSWRLSNTLEANFCVEALHERRSSAMALLRSSIATRAANSPVSSSPTCSKRLAFVSRWTARAAGWTTCLSSGCGDRSSTSASTWPSSQPVPRPGPKSAGGWTSTTGAGPTRRSTTGRPKKRTLTTGRTEARGLRRLNHEPGIPP